MYNQKTPDGDCVPEYLMNHSPTEGAQGSANSKTPNIPKGKQRAFWCRVLPTGQTNASCRLLLYCNAYVMPLSDNCDEPPAGAIPVGDDGDYEWTGWMEEACEQCETFYTFSGIVFEWIELPRTEAGFRQLAQSEERVKELEGALYPLMLMQAENCDGQIGWRSQPEAIAGEVSVKHILLAEAALKDTDLLEKARSEIARKYDHGTSALLSSSKTN